MSLTSCLKKAGAALHAEDKAAILDAARAFRKQGLSADDAARKAVAERSVELFKMLAEVEKEAKAEAVQPIDQGPDAAPEASGTDQAPIASGPADERQEAPSESIQQPKKGAKLEDAGQKIGGARKDLWAERGLLATDLDGMTEAEGATLATKQNAWKPDWSAMASDVGEPVTVAMVKVVYDSLAAKPKTDSPQGRRDYLKAMAAVREVYGTVRSPEEAKNAFVKLRQLLGVSDRRYGLSEAESEARRVLFSVYKGRSDPFVFGYNELARAKKMVADGFPGAVEPWTRRFSLRQIGGAGVTDGGIQVYGKRAEQAGTPLTPDQIRAGAWSITTKVGSEVGYAPTRADAEATAKALYERAIGANGNEKQEPTRPHLDKVKREGLPQRIDRDVTAQDLIDTFGFRGIEWGLWAAQDERQKIANMAFDSLSDLAQILNVPERALSLNGTMGLAFGARGGGKFAAHYESGKLVINMTKLRGAGSLAHEWAHAVDHYFGELDRADAYQGKARGASGWYEQQRYSSEPQQRMVQREGKWTPEKSIRLGNLRPELAAKIDALMKRLFETPIPREEAISITQADIARYEGYLRTEPTASGKQALQDVISRKQAELAALQAGGESSRTKRSSFAAEAQKLSGKSTTGYWARPTEMFARAFESYVFDRLKAMGAQSDYLVHGVEQDRYADGTRYKGNPYPTGEERAAINKAFDDLVGEIKTRPGENGNVAMFSRADASADVASAWRMLAENDDLFSFPRVESKDMQEIAQQSTPNLTVQDAENLPSDVERAWYIYPPNKPQTSENRGFIIRYKDGKVEINVSKFKEGDAGLMVYALAGAYAHNNGLEFAGDRLGITETGMQRRVENMISLALKFGTTDFLSPHQDMITKMGIDWKPGDSDHNLQQLLMASYDNAIAKFPALKDVVYDPRTGTLQSHSLGVGLSKRDRERLVEGARARAVPIGDRTLSRLGITQAIVESQAGPGRRRLLESIGQRARSALEHDRVLRGVLYSRSDAVPAVGGGVTVDSLRALAQRVRESLPDMPQVRVFESPAQLSDEGAEGALKRQIEQRGAAGDVEGALHEGQIYLFAGGIADETRAEHVLANHEVAHAGLRAILGDALSKQMHDISIRNTNVRQAALALQRSDQALTHAQAVEEVLVDMAPEALAGLQGWRALVGKARDFLRESGFTGLADRLSAWLDGTLTERQRADLEVADLVRAARSHYARKGQGEIAAQRAAAAFSRSTSTSVLDNLRQAKLPAGYIVNDFIKSSGKLSWWHKTVGTMHNLAERNPEFKRVYDSAQRFLHDVSFYATEAADLAPTLLPKLDGIRDLLRSPLSADDTKAIAAPIFEGTLSWTRDDEGVPIRTESVEDAGVRWSDAELRSMFKLEDRQIGLYHEFRAAVDRSLRDMAVSDMIRYAGNDAEAVRAAVLDADTVDQAARLLTDHLATLAAESGKDRAATLTATGEVILEKAKRASGLIDRGYAPLMRFGRYTLDVTENGERVYFGLFESQADANRFARQLRESFPEAQFNQGTVSQESYRMFAGVSPETAELFGEMLGLEQSGDKASDLAFQEWIKLSKSNRSAMNRLLHRKGVAGFSEDAGRVLAGFVYSNARQTSKNLHMGELSKAVQNIAETKGQGELMDAAVRLHQYVANPTEEAGALRGLLFAQFLGGSVAAGLVNMTQPFLVTVPYLSQFGGVTSAAAQMRAALPAAMKASTGDARLDAALKKAEEEGVVAPQEVHQLMAQARGSGALKAGDGTISGDLSAKASNFLSKLLFAWGRPFALAEQFNRRVTFIAAYRTAIKQGMPDPAGFASRAIDETQFVYTKANRPEWARGAIGGTLFTFKTYSISYVELLSRMAKSGPEGRRAALLGLATLALVSGMQGLPGSDDLDDLIDGLMQRLGYNWSTKRQRRELLAGIIGEGGADFMLRGLSGLPGAPIDVAGRLGLGNLIPGTGLLTKRADHGQDVAELLGPAGSLAKQAFTAANALVEGDIGKAGAAVAPVAMANLLKAYDMANTGMYRDTRGRKILDVDGYDALSKAIGFQPGDVSKVQRAAREVQETIDLVKMRETEIADKWARGRFEHDQDMVQDARTELSVWNRDNPEAQIKIDSAQILKRVRQMASSRTERVAKTAPKEIRATVRRELEAAQ